MSSFKNNDEIADFPYKFTNTSSSIYPNETLPDNIQHMATDVISDPKFDLRNGFKFAFQTLLSSIAEGDLDMIESFWEYSLFKEIRDGLNQLEVNGYKLDLINEKRHSFYLEPVGLCQVIGANIDRRLNEGYSQVLNSPFISSEKTKVLKVFTPPNFFNQKWPANMAIVVKIATNHKINVMNDQGEYLIKPNDYIEDEVHFIRFESLIYELNFDLSAFTKMREELSGGDISFSDWTITDIDRCLLDNPYI